MSSTNNNTLRLCHDRFEKSTKIKIVSVNVNSIIKNQRRASLLNLLNRQNPDLVMLNKTKLNKMHLLRFENYHVIRSDRNDKNPGGGTAILVKKSIKFEEIFLSTTNQKVFEYTIIKCKFKPNIPLFVIAAYAKCGSQKEFIPELNNLFASLKLNSLDNYYILAGDLNAKHSDWKNPNNNPRGISLAKWLDKNMIKYKIKFLGTKYPSYPNGQFFLDIVMADARFTYHGLEDNAKLTNVPYDSDHNAVTLQISMEDNNDLIQDLDSPEIKLDYRRTNWNKFEKTLQELYNMKIPNSRNLSLPEIDNYLSDCDKAILEAVEKSVPKIKERDSLKFYLNPKILKLQKQKNKILTQIHRLNRKWPRINTYKLKNLKKELLNLKEQLKIQFASSISEYWKEKITNISKKDSVKMFPKINNIFRKKERAEISTLKIDVNSPILEKAGLNKNNIITDNNGFTIIDTPQDKLNVLGVHFTSINNRYLDNKRPQFNNIISKETNAFKHKVKYDRDSNLTICEFEIILPTIQSRSQKMSVTSLVHKN